MSDQTFDQLPALLERCPSLARDARDAAGMDESLLARADRIHSSALRCDAYRMFSYTDTSRYDPYITKFCVGGDSGYTRDGRWIKYIVRLNLLIELAEGKPTANLNWLVEGKGISYYGMTLRRAINVLAGLASYRSRPAPKPVSGPKGSWEHGDSWKVAEAVCVHNRFAVLAHECVGTDVNSVDDWADAIDSFVPSDYSEVITSVSKKITPAEKAEHMNKFKIICGKPAKAGVPIISKERYEMIGAQEKRYDHAVLLNKRMYAAGELIRRRWGIRTDPYHTTIVRRYYALERWYREWKSLGGSQLESLETMPDFMSNPRFDPLL